MARQGWFPVVLFLGSLGLDGRQRIRSWKSEVGSWKLEVGSWKLEAGSWIIEGVYLVTHGVLGVTNYDSMILRILTSNFQPLTSNNYISISTRSLMRLRPRLMFLARWPPTPSTVSSCSTVAAIIPLRFENVLTSFP
jgi:hypothetical protein